VKLDLSKILNTILLGDVLVQMRLLPDNSIDCIICSPPYFQLRDYGWSGQWGLERTFHEYIQHLIEFMMECKRVIKPTGTIWINLADSYNGSKTGNTDNKTNSAVGTFIDKDKDKDIPNKSLLLIPHRFALRCIDELGLVLRNDIIWAAPNKMPESVTDRFSKKHEFIFFFTKSQKYFFDLDGIRDKCPPLDRWGGNKLKANGKSNWDEGTGQSSYRDRDMQPNGGMKNPGDVQRFWDGFKDMPYDEYMQMCHDYFHNPDDCWDINTKPSSHNHYASYNSELIDKPIIAGCPEGGIVLDPFCGTGTTLKRAKQLGRNVIGIEGKKEYVDLANKIFSTVENRLF
jgi:DNA modification methylase